MMAYQDPNPAAAAEEKLVAERYLKREILGEGTYGVVFKAIDTKVSGSRRPLVPQSGFVISVPRVF